MRRRGVVGLAVIVGLGAWLVLASARRDRTTPDRGPQRGEPREPAAGGGGLAARGEGGTTRPVGTARISGRVLSGDRPVAAATVTLSRQPEPDEALAAPVVGDVSVVARATTGADGRFALEDVLPGEWVVRARTPDGRRGDAWLDLPAAGASLEVLVAIDPTPRVHVLRGRAVYADGRRWGGLVLVRSEDPVRTDEEGRFVVEGLAAGKAAVSLLDPGRLRINGPPTTVPSDLEHLIVVDEHLRTLTGRVVAAEDGEGLWSARVAVEAALPRDGEMWARAEGESDGTFEIPVTTESVKIAVSAPSRCGVERRVASLESDVRIALPYVARLRGTVRTRDDAIVAGAAVRAARWSGVSGSAGFAVEPASVVTDELGKFEADVPPLDARAWVFEPRWISDSVAGIVESGRYPSLGTVDAGLALSIALLVLEAPAFEGEVVDADGEPVAGAVLSARLEDVPRSLRHVAASFEPERTASAADGSFRVAPLVPGRSYALDVETGTVADLHLRGLRAPASGMLGVEVLLPPRRSLRVVVTDAVTGAPVPGAEIRCSWSPEQRETPAEGWAVADERGVAWVEGMPGPDAACWVDAEAPGYEDGRVSEEDVDDGDAAVSLAPAKTAAIAGRVELEGGADGDPLALAGIPVVIDDRRIGVTDGAGRWRVAGLAPEETVTVEAERTWRGRRYEGRVEDVPASEGVVLRLERQEPGDPRGRILVRVLDDAGRPVPWASVKWSKDEHARTVADGRAWIDDVRAAYAIGQADPKPITLAVFDPRGDDGGPLPLGAVEGLVVADDAREVEIRLPSARSIEGYVVAGGRGVGGVEVRAARSFEGRRVPAVARARTDPTGFFRLSGVASDEYVLLFDPPETYVSPAPIRAKGGATDLDVHLREAVQARVRVVDARGASLPGTRVRLHPRVHPEAPARPRDEESRDWYEPAVTDHAGVAILRRLDPESRYDLRVEHPSAARTSHPADRGPSLPLYVFPGWQPADLEVRLSAADVVRGTVVDPRGRPVDGANVWARTSRSDWAHDRASADGSFSFPLLPPDAVVLRAVLSDDDGPFRTADVTATPGRGPVRLTLDTGPEIAVRLEGWDGGAGAALLFRAGAVPGYATDRRSIAPDGRVLFRGLEAASTYALWVPPTSAGRSLLRRGLSPRAEEIALRLTEGRPVKGRVLDWADVSDVAVDVVEEDAGVRISLDLDDDGSFRSPPLPDGRWSVVARGTRAGRDVEASSPAALGGAVDVAFR